MRLFYYSLIIWLFIFLSGFHVYIYWPGNIRAAVHDNILFSALDKSQTDIVVDAMFEKKYSIGESVIKQGTYAIHQVFYWILTILSII